MASGDIWFLLIFIILPTAVLVSGFWAFLFVRRDPRKTIPRQRQAVAEPKSTRDDIEETVQVATVAAPAVAESEPVTEEEAAEDEVEPEPVQPLPGPAASELAPVDTDEAIDEPAAIDEEPEEDEPPADVDDEDPHQGARQIDDERLVELVDVDDRDELLTEIHRKQDAQPARLESSTDEIPDLSEAVIEPARLSDTAADYEQWKPRPDLAPEEADAEAAGDWEISEDELAADVEDEEHHQVTEAAPNREPQNDADPTDEDAAEGEEDEPGDDEGPGASSGDNSRRYRRRRPRVRLMPSDNGERQGRGGRLAGRRKSRRDEGGV